LSQAGQAVVAVSISRLAVQTLPPGRISSVLTQSEGALNKDVIVGGADLADATGRTVI